MTTPLWLTVDPLRTPDSILVSPPECTCGVLQWDSPRRRRIGLVIHDVHNCPAAMDRWVVTPPHYHQRVFAQRPTARDALVAVMEALGRGFRISEISHTHTFPSHEGELVHFLVGHDDYYKVETERRYYQRLTAVPPVRGSHR